MPELTAVHVGIIAAMLVVGAILGWVFRGDRSAKEKIAINAGWQDQIQSQQSEHNRLAEQNKSLMEQIDQHHVSHQEASERAKELSVLLTESTGQNGEMQAQVKELRGKLDLTIAQRDRLRSENDRRESREVATANTMKDKDDKIFRLSRELTSWQSRLPPLVEKYQEREQIISSLEDELESTREDIHRLEDTVESNRTRIEPVGADSLPRGLDALNESHASTAEHEFVIPRDQSRGNSACDAAEVVPEGDAQQYSTGGVADPAADEESPTDNDRESGSQGNGHDTPESDDLKKIKGVGPAIERTLKRMGIHRFNQIAEMSEYDIDRVAQQLKGFRSRIYREDWIGQARDLQYKKNSDNR